nr:U1 small nuclear ribonucleoprotein C [Cryptomonas paramecium]
MLICFYCKIFIFNKSQKVYRQHTSGNRHKINICIYIKNFYLNWILKRMKD